MANPNTIWTPRETQITSTTIMAAQSNNHHRSFLLNTRASETLNRGLPVNAPLTVAIVDDIIADLGDTQRPLQDLYVVIDTVAALCGTYKEVEGLTAGMKDTLATATTALDRARGMVDQAANIEYTGLLSDNARAVTRRGCVVAARGLLLDSEAALLGLVNLPAIGQRGVPAAQRDANNISLARAVLTFQVWAGAFECGLFA